MYVITSNVTVVYGTVTGGTFRFQSEAFGLT